MKRMKQLFINSKCFLSNLCLSPSKRNLLNLYLRRGKLFVFGETLLDKGTGNKTWKERGVGEVKLLRYISKVLRFNLLKVLKNVFYFAIRHKENSRIRILMRQEKTMKVIVNHFLDPRIGLSIHTGSDKSWIWVAYDFSDNELVETVNRCLLRIIFIYIC